MKSTSADITARFTLENGEVKDLKSLSFSIPVRSLKSGTSGLDQDAYEALQASQHPNIRFNMDDAPVSASGQNTFQVKGSGTLTIAGVSRQINIEADCEKSGGIISCNGSKRLKMKDFGIEPPSALLGLLNADEQVTVNYKVKLK
jgi:polyisoprenoid-binding protein YceI